MNNAVKSIDTGRNEEKLKFIELRAKGYPYSQITKALNVSKGTLTAWNEELKEQITELKTEQLEELYHSYFMLKEARIKQLGETLNEINTALQGKSLTELPAYKLLDYKLKYMEVLKDEFIELHETKIGPKLNAEIIFDELIALLDRVRTGDISKDQAIKENYILTSMLKAYETITLEKKIAALESVIGGRKP